MKYINFGEESSLTPDDFFMKEALKEAHKALELDEVPIGAVIVCQGRIIGRGHNLTERLNDVTAHAEMQAFTAAADYLGGKYLKDCTLYVTLEPCAMCAGLLVHSRVKRLVFGAKDAKTGAAGSVLDIVRHPVLNHQLDVLDGPLAQQCADKLSEFFRRRRAEQKALKHLEKQQSVGEGQFKP